MTSANPCYCGHDCARCVTYLATVRDDDALRRTSRRFYRDTFGIDIPSDKLCCLGGRSDTVMPLCRTCPFAACCRRRGIDRCADCPDYPCPAIADYTAKYVNRVNQIPQGD